MKNFLSKLYNVFLEAQEEKAKRYVEQNKLFL